VCVSHHLFFFKLLCTCRCRYPSLSSPHMSRSANISKPLSMSCKHCLTGIKAHVAVMGCSCASCDKRLCCCWALLHLKIYLEYQGCWLASILVTTSPGNPVNFDDTQHVLALFFAFLGPAINVCSRVLNFCISLIACLGNAIECCTSSQNHNLIHVWKIRKIELLLC